MGVGHPSAHHSLDLASATRGNREDAVDAVESVGRKVGIEAHATPQEVTEIFRFLRLGT